MRDLDQQQAKLYEFWDREVASRLRPIVQRLSLTQDEKTDLIEDIRHHTVSKLLGRQHEIENMRAFATRVGINLVKDRLTQQARRPATDEASCLDSEPAHEEDDPERLATQGEIAEARRAIYQLVKSIRFEALSAEWDAVFSLVYELHFSMRQAAKCLDLPFATVQYRMKCAVEVIREELAKLARRDPDVREDIALAFGEERVQSLLREDTDQQTHLGAHKGTEVNCSHGP